METKSHNQKVLSKVINTIKRAQVQYHPFLIELRRLSDYFGKELMNKANVSEGSNLITLGESLLAGTTDKNSTISKILESLQPLLSTDQFSKLMNEYKMYQSDPTAYETVKQLAPSKPKPPTFEQLSAKFAQLKQRILNDAASKEDKINSFKMMKLILSMYKSLKQDQKYQVDEMYDGFDSWHRDLFVNSTNPLDELTYQKLKLDLINARAASNIQAKF